MEIDDTQDVQEIVSFTADERLKDLKDALEGLEKLEISLRLRLKGIENKLSSGSEDMQRLELAMLNKKEQK